MSTTATEQVSETVTVSLRNGDFQRILKNVLPHAGTDDTLPVLNAVRLDYADGRLSAVATDRYTAARDYVQLDENDGPRGSSWAFLLTASDAKELVRSKSPFVSLTYHTDDRPRLTVDDFASNRTVYPVDGQFPDTARLFKDAIERGESAKHGVPSIGLNPIYLARFAKVDTGWRKPARRYSSAASAPPLHLFIPAELKATYARMGDTFDALLMPVRLGD